MSKIKSIGITVRLPPPLYKKLADRAKAEGRSVNQEAIRLFQESLDRTISREEELLEEINQTKADLDQMKHLVAEVGARMSRLEKIEGKPRRMRAKDATVADVALAPTGAKV